MSTEARRPSIPPRPTTPPRPAQPPAVGEGGPGSESSEESGRREAGESVERAIVDAGGRMNDDSDWQAFGERDRRGSGTAARPTFGGFDWQGSRDTDGRVPGNARARESAGAGRETRQGAGDLGRPVFGSAGAGRQDVGGTAPRARGDMSAGRPPIRTTNGTDSASTPAGDKAHGTSDSRRTDGDGSGNRATSTPADTSGAPAQPRIGSGSGPQESPRPGAPFPGSIPPPPPASARFPDTPPASGGAESSTDAGHRGAPAGSPTPGDRTPRPGSATPVPSSRRETDASPPPPSPRGPAPGPMPPAASAGNRAPGARPRPASRTPESYGPSAGGTSASPATNPGMAAPGPMPPASDAPSRGTDTGSASVPPRPRTRPTVPPRRTGGPAETASETTFRMRPVPAAGDGPVGPASAARAGSGGTAVPPMPDARPGFPRRPTREAPVSGAPGMPPAPTTPPRTASFTPDPALSWSAALPPHDGTPANGRPVVSFAEPEVGYRERSWGVRIPPRITAVAACVVLGLGLIGGAVTGSWLIGGSGDEGRGDTFTQAGELWHSVPVDQLFPPTVDGQGAGPGGADRTWTRIAVAPDSGCKDAFDPLLRKALAPVGCERLLRATYTDATQSYVTTVGLLFTDADATAMRDLDTRFTREGLGSRTDLMPLPYAAKNTLAAGFGAEQRASWTISVLTDAPVVAYAVSGWADGRTVDTPEPAEKAMESGDTTPAAQAGLGNEAQGLADRVERALRKTVTSPPEQSS
ncbi:hypothetical protein ACIP2Y_26785 [Streptomyces sviceus]|uniref:hypothetical protein n=1 Tax=Streptomyces sviceus TaxID=285530 RepID=UPI00382BEDFC